MLFIFIFICLRVDINSKSLFPAICSFADNSSCVLLLQQNMLLSPEASQKAEGLQEYSKSIKLRLL